MNELAYNLESFNPAFTAVLLKVWLTVPFLERDTHQRLPFRDCYFGANNGFSLGSAHGVQKLSSMEV